MNIETHTLTNVTGQTIIALPITGPAPAYGFCSSEKLVQSALNMYQKYELSKVHTRVMVCARGNAGLIQVTCSIKVCMPEVFFPDPCEDLRKGRKIAG